MKRTTGVALVAALVMTGMAARTAAQADPFVTARYDISIKHNADALAIIDSGQFDINMQSEEGYTLLHNAADAGNLEMVQALLARGADPNLKTAAGLKPYDVATGTMVKAALAKAMNAPAMVSTRPAKAAHLHDRGEIAVGKRADLVRVRLHGDMPVIKGVWRRGQRVS